MGIDTSCKYKKAQWLLTALNCFGAGVIITTCFTHMLPEVNDFLEMNYKQKTITNSGLALGEILLICGFLMIYLVEEVAHAVLLKMKVTEKSNEMENQAKESCILPQDNCECEEIPANILTNLNEASFQVAFRGFFVVLAISLHAVFEGIAMGLMKKPHAVWSLCFAIAAHKFIISFCVGLQLTTSGMKPLVITVYMTIFSLITPLGIGIGMGMASIQSTAIQSPTVTVFQGLAAGTLLYVVFFEVLEKERLKKSYGLTQVTFIVLGFVVMILVELIEGKHHHHGHHAQKSEVCTMNLTSLWTKNNFSDAGASAVPELQVNVTCLGGELKLL